MLVTEYINGMILKTYIRNQIVHTTIYISVIDVMSVKKCRSWPDAASETRRLVWVYTFCICPKVPFRMTLAIYNFMSLRLVSNLGLCSVIV